MPTVLITGPTVTQNKTIANSHGICLWRDGQAELTMMITGVSRQLPNSELSMSDEETSVFSELP